MMLELPEDCCWMYFEGANMFNLETLCVFLRDSVNGTDAWQCPSVHRWLANLSLCPPSLPPNHLPFSPLPSPGRQPCVNALAAHPCPWLQLISSEEVQVPSINEPWRLLVRSGIDCQSSDSGGTHRLALWLNQWLVLPVFIKVEFCMGKSGGRRAERESAWKTLKS